AKTPIFLLACSKLTNYGIEFELIVTKGKIIGRPLGFALANYSLAI
ncbi:MAG: hypothetical protein ACI9DJ_003444, partial [Algoriphagus sp.]